MAFEYLNTFLNSFRNQGRYSEIINRMLPPAVQLWGKKEAVWVDTADAWRLYIDIPELRAVINKRATMMASNEPKLYDAKGEQVESHWLLDLIKTPNAVQSWSDVVYAISVQDALYSNVICYCPKRILNVRNLFVPLPANKVEINLTGKKLKQMDKENLIDTFTFTYDDESKERIEWQDAVYLTTADGMNIVKPISRIDSLKYPLSNIQAGYKKRNVLLENIGAIGILSAQQNDMGGAIPMTPEEREQIRKDWYRRGKDELIITEANVSWQPMSFPTRDLMLFEELTADKIAIIDTYGLSVNLFSSEKGATFSNVKDSIRMVYTDTIIPETQQIYNSIMSQIGLEQEGYYLEACFEHLPVLQTDHKEQSEVRRTNAETFRILTEAGITLRDDERERLLNLNDY
jgi:hypothetical protein